MPPVLSFLAVLFTGVSKAGFPGFSLIGVWLLAETFEAKPSVGILLPLLVLADLVLYPVLARHASWKPVWRVLPPAVLGVLGGWGLLHLIDNQLAGRLIGALILLLVALQFSRRYHPEWFDGIAGSRTFCWALGIFGGVATTLANAAGPIMSLYFLAQRLKKDELIGVAARFFLLINVAKVPLLWQTGLITPKSLGIDLWLAPVVLGGIVLGRYLLRHVSEALFGQLIVLAAGLAGLKMLVG